MSRRTLTGRSGKITAREFPNNMGLSGNMKRRNL